ncbi:MAG TPA: glycosyltransferase family 2 protein [Kiritimatiellia bacterium]|nr:glycosyltransferase family 2 protein [Kiritimatiellia bacterium]
MRNPPVSVVIPTHNRGPYIEAALASVLNQTFADFEVVVVDDGSTDNTAQALKKLQGYDPRVRVVDNTGRHGAAAARNTGIHAARGEWIAFLDSDDAWAPGKLEKFMAATGGDALLIGSDYRMIDKDTGQHQTMLEFVREVMLPWWQNDQYARRIIDCDTLLKDGFLLEDKQTIIGMTIGGYLWPHTSSVVVRKAAVDAAGGFNEKLPRTEDMDLWLKILQRGSYVFINEVLGDYDITGRTAVSGDRYRTTDSKRRFDAYIEAYLHLKFARGMPRRFPLNRDQAAFLFRRLASHHRLCGYYARGDRPVSCAWHYACALTMSPSHRRQLRHNSARFFQNPW